ALRKRRPLRRRQLPLEALEQSIDHQPLTLVQREIAQLLPVSRRRNHAGQRSLCTLNRARETAKEPLHPWRDVHRPPLCLLEDAVVVAAFPADLRGHAVEPLRAPPRTCP